MHDITVEKGMVRFPIWLVLEGERILAVTTSETYARAFADGELTVIRKTVTIPKPEQVDLRSA